MAGGKLDCALVPGSFDPITLGHMDVILAACDFCQRVIVGVTFNSKKKDSGWLTLDERVQLIQEATEPYRDVIEVVQYSGATIRFAAEAGATVIVRGLRNGLDLEYEAAIEAANKALSLDELGRRIRTVFVPTEPGLSQVSSSSVKELVSVNCSKQVLQQFVPPEVAEHLAKRYRLTS